MNRFNPLANKMSFAALFAAMGVAAASAAESTNSSPAPATLTYRYSFATDANDSVGNAHGTLQGSAAIRDGQVHLNGTRGTYVLQ